MFTKNRDKTSSEDCNMFNFSEKFQEQFNHVQQQFDKWTTFEQMYASVDLTKKLSMPYRYFLSQLLCQMNSQVENNDMFHHTVHQANAPAILACLLSDPDDKIISTLLLYLPLVSTTTANDKLLEAYRDVFVYLDSKLANPSNFSCTEQQLIQYCQQMKFFIQKHPSLQKFLIDIPQLSALATSGKPNSNENTEEILATQRLQQPLQCYPSVRSYQQISPTSTTASLLTNFVSEGSHHTNVSQQPIRKDASDSGVDLSEPCLTNSVQNLLSTQTSQHSSVGRSHSANLGSNNEEDNQSNHQFVIKSSSSPTPEQTTTVRPSFVPLTAVLSAPAPSHHSYYSDFRHQNSIYSHQQGRPTLTISDEDEEEPSTHLYSQNLFTSTDKFYSDMNATENNTNNNRLRQFCSLRNRPVRTHMNNSANNSESVSQYLGVDGVSGSTRNTFIQPNSGMRDVPKWLKNLRLHKYAFFFSQMTYDQMMGLTIDQLKEGKITDGACTKILLNIKKLKERQVLLHQCLIDIDNEQIEMKTVLQHLNDLMLTPIRAPQTDQNNNDNEENLPKLIMQVLEKVYYQLTSNTSSTTILSDMCNNLVGLFDRCYKHEAFSADQRHELLRWRGPLCIKLQTSGKIEYKSMQSSSSSSANRRPQLKPQTSMGSMNSTQIVKPAIRNIKSIAPYYPNYQSTSIPLSRQHNSDLPSSNGNNSNSNEINFIRRPTKSPTLIFTPNNDSPDETGATQSSPNSHLSIVSSHSLQEQTSYHQTQPYITDRSGIGGGNLRPSFNYVASTSQRTNGGYLAANQHQLLTRKTSIDPYGESHFEDKNKLCKTFSDPSRIRFCHPSPTQQSANHLRIASQSKTYQSTSTPYSSRQYLSRSQPTSNNTKPFFELDSIAQSPIQKSYSDKEASIYFKDDENNNHLITTPTSSSKDTKTDDAEFALKQRHNSTEFDTLCRQITESAISDDVIDQVMEQKYSSDIQTTKSSPASSIDTE